MSESVFEKICKLLDSEKVEYRIITHPPEGKCEDISKIRGTRISQGAKALSCKVTINSEKNSVLAILPADMKANFKRLAKVLGGTKATLLNRDYAEKLTGCKIGAIPPFVFNDKLHLVVDKSLFERNDEIAFNAGRLDASIIMPSTAYRSIVKKMNGIEAEFSGG